MELILGPPGTGKTTHLLNLVETALTKYDPDQIGFMTFTKQAANEAKDRAKVRFNYTDRDLPFFRTIHSLAFHQLSLHRDQVMNKDDYKKLGDLLGLKIGTQDVDQGLHLGAEKGDKLVFFEQLARSLDAPIEKVCYDVNPWEAKRFAETLTEFKSENGFVDFTDMIEMFVNSDALIPRFKMLFVDEAQDLSPIHWMVIDKLIERAETVYIAGDDDQSIYKFAGADTARFLALKSARTTVLSLSHRLPRKVWNFANDISMRIRSRYTKEWSARDEEGEIYKYGAVDNVDFSQETWLLLARHLYLLDGMVEILRRQGYPYVHRGTSSVNNKQTQAIASWERLRRGEPIFAYQAKRMLTVVRPDLIGVPLSKDLDERSAVTGGMLGWLSTPPDWMEALKLHPYEREYYRAVLRRGESLTKEPRLKVSTIHGAKGGQADNAVLMPDMSDKCYRDYQTNGDDECRVFYVGATRCKQRLHVIHPSSPRFFRLPT